MRTGVDQKTSQILLIIFTILALWNQYQLLNCFYQVDESSTVLVTKMLVHGNKLYSQIFTQHGPLTFIPGIIVSLFGNFSLPVYRIPIFILEWLAIISLYRSPVLSPE